MYKNSRQAFTMMELVFVIVVIGILSAIAIPKFAVTRGDAIMTQAKTTVASIRSAIATERQKRILRGSFDKIKYLGEDNQEEAGKDVIFNGFDNNTSTPVLEYALKPCATTSSTSCWYRSAKGDGTSSNPSKYKFMLPTSGEVEFELKDNKFTCDTTDANCLTLTQ